jgi:hypothetical protein
MEARGEASQGDGEEAAVAGQAPPANATSGGACMGRRRRKVLET